MPSQKAAAKSNEVQKPPEEQQKQSLQMPENAQRVPHLMMYGRPGNTLIRDGKCYLLKRSELDPRWTEPQFIDEKFVDRSRLDSLNLLHVNPELTVRKKMKCICSRMIDLRHEWYAHLYDGTILCSSCARCNRCFILSIHVARKLVSIDGLVLCYKCMLTYGNYREKPHIKIEYIDRQKPLDDNRNNETVSHKGSSSRINIETSSEDANNNNNNSSSNSNNSNINKNSNSINGNNNSNSNNNNNNNSKNNNNIDASSEDANKNNKINSNNNSSSKNNNNNSKNNSSNNNSSNNNNSKKIKSNNKNIPNKASSECTNKNCTKTKNGSLKDDSEENPKDLSKAVATNNDDEKALPHRFRDEGRRPLRKIHYPKPRSDNCGRPDYKLVPPPFLAVDRNEGIQVCPECQQPALTNALVIPGYARVYHDTCFRCDGCQKPMFEGYQLPVERFQSCSCPQQPKVWCKAFNCRIARMNHHEERNCGLAPVHPAK